MFRPAEARAGRQQRERSAETRVQVELADDGSAHIAWPALLSVLTSTRPAASTRGSDLRSLNLFEFFVSTGSTTPACPRSRRPLRTLPSAPKPESGNGSPRASAATVSGATTATKTAWVSAVQHRRGVLHQLKHHCRSAVVPPGLFLHRRINRSHSASHPENRVHPE